MNGTRRDAVCYLGFITNGYVALVHKLDSCAPPFQRTCRQYRHDECRYVSIDLA